ncbi:transposase [Streptomyces sp. NPDC059355]|uniref:transposase n=1 Tax=Streptomyces sp. NPDC059355 TaxID=3346811 RepID=UPI0036B08FFD
MTRLRIVPPGRGPGDLRDPECERLRPFLPVSNRRCGRRRDHRQVIDGIPRRVSTGVQWRDLPERFGPCKTVYERHRLRSAHGTRERLLQQVQAAADAAGEIGCVPSPFHVLVTNPRDRRGSVPGGLQ